MKMMAKVRNSYAAAAAAIPLIMRILNQTIPKRHFICIFYGRHFRLTEFLFLLFLFAFRFFSSFIFDEILRLRTPLSTERMRAREH